MPWAWPCLMPHARTLNVYVIPLTFVPGPNLMCRVLGIHNTMNTVVNINRRHLLLSKFIPKTRKNLNWGPPLPQLRFMVIFMAILVYTKADQYVQKRV